ncbi:MAG: tetratricopeptide repeat protein [Bacteroidales bacterium]
MNIKNYILILLLALVSPLWGADGALDLQKQAAQAYNSGDYAQAAQHYESLLNEGYISGELYYNLGNAYYKDKNIAQAILNYERASLLSPGDDDVRVNLEIAREQVVDKIDTLGRIFLVEWIDAVVNSRSSNGWAVVAIVAFISLLLSLALYFFGNRIWAKKLGFFLGLFMVMITLFANYGARVQRDKLVERNSAIVFASSVSCKSTPAVSGTNLFVLHQGTKVTIKSKLGEWSEIVLSDGNVGWIPSADIVVI